MDSLSCEFEQSGFQFPQDPFNTFPSLAFSQDTAGVVKIRAGEAILGQESSARFCSVICGDDE